MCESPRTFCSSKNGRGQSSCPPRGPGATGQQREVGRSLGDRLVLLLAFSMATQAHSTGRLTETLVMRDLVPDLFGNIAAAPSLFPSSLESSCLGKNPSCSSREYTDGAASMGQAGLSFIWSPSPLLFLTSQSVLSSGLRGAPSGTTVRVTAGGRGSRSGGRSRSSRFPQGAGLRRPQPARAG